MCCPDSGIVLDCIDSLYLILSNFKCILLVLNPRLRTLDSVVVKSQHCLDRIEAFNYSNGSSQKNNQIRLTHYNEIDIQSKRNFHVEPL